MPRPIDLRSDTVTRPTAAMRAAMADAEVGDDVYGEDPTVNELEATAAEIFGKEAGLLLASGTQANAVATLVHTNPGQLAYCEVGAHVGIHEGGGYAALAGIALEKIPTPDGMLTADLVEERILPEDPHLAEPRLIWVENTHNGAGGLPTPKSEIDELGLLARRRGLSLHIDGARIFNAATALGCHVAELTAAADSVQFCLSKGLGAPVGSMLVGSPEFIARARRKRKLLGGAMRQAGVIAAAGLIALKDMPAKLADDHARARRLAQALGDVPGLAVRNPEPASNMVYVEIDESLIRPDALVERTRSEGVLIGPVARSGNVSRLVLHHQVEDADVEIAIDVIGRSAQALAGR